MNQQFYIEVNGQQTGPFTLDELKTKSIQRDTLVWTEGMSNWTRAEQIPALTGIVQTVPPPLPNAQAAASSRQTPPPRIPTSTQSHFGYVLAGRGDRFLASIIDAIGLFIILGILYVVFLDGSISNITDNSADSLRNKGISILISAISGIIFYPMWSGNIGHKVVGIKVISSVDGSDCNKAGEGLIREVLKNILTWLVIPVIWLLWDNDKQNLYDKISKTFVVKR
jgi:uncharacterized RDD family membrane protein YckC